MTSQPRPVWPNRQERDRMMLAATHLRDAGCYPKTVAALERLVAAWDAAPADAAEAAHEVLSLYGMGFQTRKPLANDLLLALGHPHTEQA